jgi:2-polyprenyl-3-methyl-5-hydroxy-6-metoxy-1,4-benzoquinol methylase
LAYRQIAGVGNAEFRNEWVFLTLTNLATPQHVGGPTLLDVGAGTSPYKTDAVGLGYAYRSHDFSEYVPDAASPGLQNQSWVYAAHDFTCDVTEIPDEAASDVVLCTEVLEHVPDPVRAFQRLASLVKPGGHLVVTVPFLSLMHQSPFWFSSGLSPFWFEYWSERTELEIHELTVQGDYVDLMAQEVGRMLVFKPRIYGLNRVGSATVKKLRKRLPTSILESGGLGTLFVGTKRVV